MDSTFVQAVIYSFLANGLICRSVFGPKCLTSYSSGGIRCLNGVKCNTLE